MAKINIIGDAVVVTSTIKFSDIQKLEKLKPDILAIKDDDGNEVFRIATGERAKVASFGVVFSGETRDERKLATVTMAVSETDGDIREVVADLLGETLEYLAAVETQVACKLPEILRRRDALIASIEVN